MAPSGKTTSARRLARNSFSILPLLALAFLIYSVPLDSNGTTIVAWGAGKTVSKTDGINFGQSIIPADLTNAAMIATGWSQSEALLTNGTMVFWGSNVVAVSCGLYSSLVLKSDGTVSAWGGEGTVNYGQGTVPNGITNIVAVSAGGYFNLVLRLN